MSLYLPGPFMLPWEQRLCECVCVCVCLGKGVERREREKAMWLPFSRNPPELCFWQLKVKVTALLFSHCCCLLFRWEIGIKILYYSWWQPVENALTLTSIYGLDNRSYTGSLMHSCKHQFAWVWRIIKTQTPLSILALMCLDATVCKRDVKCSVNIQLNRHTDLST